MDNVKGKRAPLRRSVRNDVLLIVTVLLLLFLIGTCLLLTQKKGDTVRVSVNGELYGTYPLHRDRTVEIITEAGYNLLVIRDGAVFMETADCPDGICTAHRPIDGTRESIVCLPHGVVVSVLRVADSDAPDISV